jgi:hypothetical protein
MVLAMARGWEVWFFHKRVGFMNGKEEERGHEGLA